MSTRRKHPKKKPSQRRQITFLVGAEEGQVWTEELAGQLVGQYTRFQGLVEVQVLNAVPTHDGAYVSITVAVPNKILDKLGIGTGTEGLSYGPT